MLLSSALFDVTAFTPSLAELINLSKFSPLHKLMRICNGCHLRVSSFTKQKLLFGLIDSEVVVRGFILVKPVPSCYTDSLWSMSSFNERMFSSLFCEKTLFLRCRAKCTLKWASACTAME